MWLTIWLACHQEAPVETTSTETKPVPEQETLVKQSTEEVKSFLEGRLFFAKPPECMSDCIVKVTRQVDKWTPQTAIDSLYEGPSKEEEGLRFIDCGSTGAKLQTVESGVAKVQLEGDCGDCGTMSVYDLLLPTLKAFPEIDVVQLYDSRGKSQIEGPKVDSRPACLEP